MTVAGRKNCHKHFHVKYSEQSTGPEGLELRKMRIRAKISSFRDHSTGKCYGGTWLGVSNTSQ